MGRRACNRLCEKLKIVVIQSLFCLGLFAKKYLFWDFFALSSPTFPTCITVLWAFKRKSRPLSHIRENIAWPHTQGRGGGRAYILIFPATQANSGIDRSIRGHSASTCLISLLTVFWINILQGKAKPLPWLAGKRVIFTSFWLCFGGDYV